MKKTRHLFFVITMLFCLSFGAISTQAAAATTTTSVKTTVKVIKYSNPFKKIVVDGRDCTSDFKNKNGSGISFMGRNIKITPNKNWRVKSIYTYKPGATKMKKVKGSSVTIPTNCRAFITMENKKNKLIEKVTFDEMDTSEDPGFIF